MNKIGKQNPHLTSTSSTLTENGGRAGANGSGDGNDDEYDNGSSDMTAIVSALANRRESDDDDDTSPRGYHHLSQHSHRTHHKKHHGHHHHGHHHHHHYNAGSVESLDVSYFPKDIQHISRMFIEASKFPRPRSDSNFQLDPATTEPQHGQTAAAKHPLQPHNRHMPAGSVFYKSETRLFPLSPLTPPHPLAAHHGDHHHSSESGRGRGAGDSPGSLSPPRMARTESQRRPVFPVSIPGFLAPPLMPLLAAESPAIQRADSRKGGSDGSGSGSASASSVRTIRHQESSASVTTSVTQATPKRGQEQLPPPRYEET